MSSEYVLRTEWDSESLLSQLKLSLLILSRNLIVLDAQKSELLRNSLFLWVGLDLSLTVEPQLLATMLRRNSASLYDGSRLLANQSLIFALRLLDSLRTRLTNSELLHTTLLDHLSLPSALAWFWSKTPSMLQMLVRTLRSLIPLRLPFPSLGSAPSSMVVPRLTDSSWKFSKREMRLGSSAQAVI